MKRKVLFLLVLIFVMLASVSGVLADELEDLLNDLRRANELKRQHEEMVQRQNAVRRGDFDTLSIYFLKDAIRALERSKETIQQCLQYDDEVMLQVQYGRYISAFELCRRQGKGVQECIQMVKETKERWKARCKITDDLLRLMYYKAKLRTEEIKKALKDTKNRIDACVRVERGWSTGLAALADREICAFQSQMLSKWYPGSEFNLATGTGKMVLPDGAFYYQGWIFIRGDFPLPGGILVQVFDNRMNFVAGSYNIAVNLKMQDWEIVEFNLPFDSHTEQILNTLSGRGVRLTNKEIIDLVNGYLHNTVWEVDLPLTFQKLLLEAAERRFFFESLLEFYAYDSYLNRVIAEEARLKQQLTQTKQDPQPQLQPQPQPQQKTKKGRGTKK